MKIIRDSEKAHWAIGKQVECPRCETIVQFEVLEDFRRISYTENQVLYDCPRCKTRQEFDKPAKARPAYHYPGTMLCGAGGTTKWEDVKLPAKPTLMERANRSNVNEAVPEKRDALDADWMGNYETQQEYLGK